MFWDCREMVVEIKVEIRWGAQLTRVRSLPVSYVNNAEA